MIKDRALPALLLLLALAFAVAPALTPPFTGYDPGQFPVAIARPAIQPAGYAFAIWGLIYFWLILHTAYGLWRRSGAPAWQANRRPLAGALALGTLWLAIAGVAPLTATVVILVMAALAILAFLRAPAVEDRWLLSAPLAIFAGWLTAASAASTGIMLGGYGILPNAGAAVVMLTLAVMLALWVQSRSPRMPLYSATMIWAILAIAAANRTELPMVSLVALAGAALLAATAIWQMRR